jgi:putative MATE family efflux protein
VTQVGAKPTKFDRSLIDGPLGRAVWRLAWPTMLQNAIAGLQFMIDQAMVGHYVGYTGNAAVGVSWQIILVVVAFISSLFTGMAVLVARFAGANDAEKVNRVVYQAFLTAVGLSVVMALVGYFGAPRLLDVVNAAPEVRAQALPFLRAIFMGIFGMMTFFMLSSAFRAAGDPRTPLRLGIAMTAMTVTFNVLLIPRVGTIGAALGTIASSTMIAIYGIWQFTRPESVIHFHRGMDRSLDLSVVRSLFRFGLPTGVQGIAMNVGGVLMLRFVGSLEQSAEAQASYAVCYSQLFSLITWTSNGLMGAAATMAGQNLGAGNPRRAAQGVLMSSRIGIGVAAVVGATFVLIPSYLLKIFGMTDPVVLMLSRQLLMFLSVSGFFITVALSYTGGLQGTGDTKSPLYISIVSQVIVPLGLCALFQMTSGLEPTDIWLAIVVGHIIRCTLSVARFRQEKWRNIAIDIQPARP